MLYCMLQYEYMQVSNTWLSLQATSGYSSRSTWQNDKVLAAPSVRKPVPGISTFSPAPPRGQHSITAIMIVPHVEAFPLLSLFTPYKDEDGRSAGVTWVHKGLYPHL